jgi:hypothetical protein
MIEEKSNNSNTSSVSREQNYHGTFHEELIKTEKLSGSLAMTSMPHPNWTVQ